MALVINTNVSSLNAQNNLNKTQSLLSKATEDLSSGLKINSAADNAAGYAISQRFTTQIGGLNQASSNASDAISLAQTTESALTQITSNLQAVRDLAVQAANGTYTDSDRAAINTTVQQYLQEITRTANQTTFNGQNVLNGTTQSVNFQVGAEVGQTISVDLGTGARADQLGKDVTSLSTASLASAFTTSGGASVSMDLSGVSVDGVKLSGTAHSAQDIVDNINALNINSSMSGFNGPTGATISAALNASGGIDLISRGGTGGTSSISITAATGSAQGATAITGAASKNADGSDTTGNSLANGDVLNVTDANMLIARIDSALSSVSTITSNLGAVQNRFQSTISSLSAESSNLTSAQSTIQDANFAQETANLSKANVLQQAGISVLATANSQPQQILKLLQ